MFFRSWYMTRKFGPRSRSQAPHHHHPSRLLTAPIHFVCFRVLETCKRLEQRTRTCARANDCSTRQPASIPWPYLTHGRPTTLARSRTRSVPKHTASTQLVGILPGGGSMALSGRSPGSSSLFIRYFSTSRRRLLLRYVGYTD